MKWEETTDKDIYKIKGNPLVEDPISYIEKYEDLQIGISYEMYFDGFLFWGKDKINKIKIVPLTERSVNGEGLSKEEFELFSKIAYQEAGNKEMKKQEIGFNEEKLIIESAQYNDSIIKLTYGFMDDRVGATIEIEPINE
jgi:hypothetical protein